MRRQGQAQLTRFLLGQVGVWVLGGAEQAVKFAQQLGRQQHRSDQAVSEGHRLNRRQIARR
ncbi:hypothetical protein [Deinococcus alpinitundrae]|uniref:hypothetical protein n=1 Tax=Deinococcus alpinitundrae TaxID=468913 RepID=UPI00137B6093|nr:hypothetical protein [Deinococcus alpinitundrae]